MTSTESNASPTTPRPEDRSPEQVIADLDWLRQLRAETRERWGGTVGGFDAHLDTLDTSGQAIDLILRKAAR
jgi:hypothetical protein